MTPHRSSPTSCADSTGSRWLWNWAATRVRFFGVRGLAERLDDRLRLLVAGRSMPPRQQTLRATLDWSYDLLGQPERHLFERLAPFAGGSTLADAEAICAAGSST